MLREWGSMLAWGADYIPLSYVSQANCIGRGICLPTICHTPNRCTWNRTSRINRGPIAKSMNLNLALSPVKGASKQGAPPTSRGSFVGIVMRSATQREVGSVDIDVEALWQMV